MADEVLINFVGNTEQLQPVEDVLTDIVEKSGDIGAAWKKTTEKMAADTKTSVESSNKLAKSIENIATATKSMDKAVIAGAYKQYLKEIQAQLGLTTKELTAYINNARKAAQTAILTAATDDEVKELTLSIEVMNDQLVELGKAEESLGGKTTTLRQRLKEAKEELVALADAGITSGPAFEAAKKKAGDLDDQMRDLNATIKGTGSDTKHIDGLISLASGVAGGFAVAQGAAALFGSENEEVQKALLKVNAAMSILQGLQAIQNVLQKESAASLLFTTSARAANTTAVVAETVALEADVVATEAATVATTELNTAMSLNPVGIIIVAILAAVAAFNIFNKEVETAAEKTERLAKEAEDLYDSLQKISKVNQVYVNRDVEIVKNNVLIDQLTAQGAGIAKINDLKKQTLKLQTDNLKTELYNINAAQELTKDGTQFTERELAVKSQIYQNDKAQLLLDIETNKVLRERALKSSSGFAAADLAKAKIAILQNQVDSIDSIKAVTDAEIDAIKARRAEELNNIELTQGERYAITAEANLKIAELQKAQDVKLLNIERSSLNAKLSLVQKGSEKEYDLKVKQLQQNQATELQATELTQEQILEIKNKYQALQVDLDRQFAEQKISNEISYLNSYLDEFGLTEDRKLELTIRRLDRQRDLEISQADNNAAKIKEINAKYDKQILDSKKATIAAVLAEQIRALNAFAAISDARAQRILASDQADIDKKVFASELILNHELNVLFKEEEALKKQKAGNLITQKDYDVQLQEINNKRAAATIANEERITAATNKEIDKRLNKLKSVFDIFQKGLNATLGAGAFTTALGELQNFGLEVVKIFEKLKEKQKVTADDLRALATVAIQTTQAIVNQIYADAAAKRQQILADDLAALEENKQKELSTLNLTEQNKADIALRFRNQERRIKIEAFNADKEAKKSQALINGALAFTLALASYSYPYNLVVAGITAALTGLEIAEINRQQPPRFKKGGYTGDKGVNDEAGIVHGKEFVTHASATKEWRGALEAMNAGTFDQYIMHEFKDFIFPQIPKDLNVTGGTEINYDQLASAVAAHLKGVIPAPAQITIVQDETGFHKFIQQGNSRVESLNKHFSMTSE